ncbi:MAG: DUF1343 domain-containing protein [candidate division KSB1 bacterium]|nr:DUF1343 domain-containing protein [candidate division KSB1 bacterium]
MNVSSGATFGMAGLVCLGLTMGCAPSRRAGIGAQPYPSVARPVRTGLEVLLHDPPQELRSLRLGLITNPTGVTSDLRQNVDALLQAGFRITALFGPEHGIRGDVEGGKEIESYVDARTGITVHSLYGRHRKPSPEMLQGVDALVFDIQDIGIRPYTYISTLALAMEAAAEKGIPLYVLDRPNPLGGLRVEGPVLEERFRSFIGIHPIPYVHGLTVGELARLFNGEFQIGCRLHVVNMQGWRRFFLWPDTGLPWVPTSPHIPHWFSALYCAATGALGELGTVSEGVGTPSPFELVGAPWVDAYRLADELNSRHLPGVLFRPVTFRPFYFRFAGQSLGGIHICITDPRRFEPVRTQVHILHALVKLYGPEPVLQSERTDAFDKAWGTDGVRKRLQAGESPESIIASWAEEVERFCQRRQEYLLY